MAMSFAQKKIVWTATSDWTRYSIPIHGLSADDMESLCKLQEVMDEIKYQDAHALVGDLMDLMFRFDQRTKNELDYAIADLRKIFQTYVQKSETIFI